MASSLLLAAGLLFPAISLLSFIASTLQSVMSKKHSSGIYVPLIGPVLLDYWLLSVEGQHWMLAVPWLVDIGTIFFAIATPRLALEIWNTSRFTRLFRLTGTKENQSVEISFHKGGHYILQKRWMRPEGQVGVVAVGEPGTYIEEPGLLMLTSHTGRVRRITNDGQIYVVQDSDSPEDYKVSDWELRPNA